MLLAILHSTGGGKLHPGLHECVNARAAFRSGDSEWHVCEGTDGEVSESVGITEDGEAGTGKTEVVESQLIPLLVNDFRKMGVLVSASSSLAGQEIHCIVCWGCIAARRPLMTSL